MQHCTPQQLAAALKTNTAWQLLDVREAWEYDIAHIENSILIPLGQLMGRLDELEVNQPYVVICHHGVRSMHACYVLERSGFEVINLMGGIDQWAKTIDPSMPLY
ncbi:MAG: sulfurtransferase [Thiofilum sp.]|nr:sulfurtransferase [Thiofilum sp.]